ncbi:MAG: SUMF1/EgtB/PvdO family nonheme iron enzyme [Bacteroidota bacterium]
MIIFVLSTIFSNPGTINKSSINSENNGVEMISIEKGTFIMGGTRDDEYTLEWKKLIHKVTLDYDFLMGKYELTKTQFLEF